MDIYIEHWRIHILLKHIWDIYKYHHMLRDKSDLKKFQMIGIIKNTFF